PRSKGGARPAAALLTPDLRQLAIGRHDLDRESLAVAGGAEAVGLARAAVGPDVLEAVIGDDAARLVAADRALRLRSGRIVGGVLLRPADSGCTGFRPAGRHRFGATRARPRPAFER